LGGGILPLRVVLSMHLVKPADVTLREATRSEIAAAFQQYVKDAVEVRIVGSFWADSHAAP